MRRLTVNLLYKMINIIYRGNFNGPDRRSPVASRRTCFGVCAVHPDVRSAEEEELKYLYADISDISTLFF